MGSDEVATKTPGQEADFFYNSKCFSVMEHFTGDSKLSFEVLI
jgi:hypothetical protein